MNENTGKGTYRREIIITGFGGQGIVLAGRIVGEAAVLGDKRESTFVQSYGPEARGGECSAQVIISDSPIHYPYVRNPDILMCMSQGGYEKFIRSLKEDGILIIDEDMINPSGFRGEEPFSIPSTRLAEEMGRKMVANIIMLGFFTSITGAISIESALMAISRSVPKGTEGFNIKAFNKGYETGIATIKGRIKKAEGRSRVE